MRRPLVQLWCLMLCCLAAGCAARAVGQKAPPAKKALAAKAPAADNKAPTQTWTVEGWGKTVEDAEAHALKNLAKKVTAYMQSQDPTFVLAPSPEFLKKTVLTGSPQPAPNQPKVEVGNQQLECWLWTVNGLPSHVVETLRREDTKYRAQRATEERSVVAEERMARQGKLLAVLVASLAGIWLVGRVLAPRAKTAMSKS